MGALTADGRPCVLDGGLATELEARGATLDTPLWSARLLRDAHGLEGTFDYPHHTVLDRCAPLDPWAVGRPPGRR